VRLSSFDTKYPNAQPSHHVLPGTPSPHSLVLSFTHDFKVVDYGNADWSWVPGRIRQLKSEGPNDLVVGADEIVYEGDDAFFFNRSSAFSFDNDFIDIVATLHWPS
jgi:hypothetical protein